MTTARREEEEKEGNRQPPHVWSCPTFEPWLCLWVLGQCAGGSVQYLAIGHLVIMVGMKVNKFAL